MKKIRSYIFNTFTQEEYSEIINVCPTFILNGYREFTYHKFYVSYILEVEFLDMTFHN
jgi:hypothetical protein